MIEVAFTKCAGLMTIWSDHIAIHIFPKANYRIYGRVRSWYDGPIYDYGFGPFLLIVTQPESDFWCRFNELLFTGIQKDQY